MHGPALQVIQAYDLAAHQGADTESWIEAVDDAALGDAAPGERHEAPATIAQATPNASPDTSLEPEPERNAAAAGPVEPPAIATSPSVTAFTAPASDDEAAEPETGKYVFRRGPVFIDSVTMLDHAGQPATRLTTVQPFTLRIAYHCKGALPDETLGVAIAVNRLADLAPVLQWYTQFIRPDETRETYATAPFRGKAARRGLIELAFAYAPMGKGEYILSLGLLPNAPGTWEFYEYRHFFYPFQVTDTSLAVGAPIFFEPEQVRFVDLTVGAEGGERARA
jgi:hypothetical protein